MREKAVMWATQNPMEKLFFVVVRNKDSTLTSLLEMELREFFYEQHKLQNVEVLCLCSKPEDTLRDLLKEVTSRPPGSWMVDELVMPGGFLEYEMQKSHKQWGKELGLLQQRFEAQAGKPPLWIACAGIWRGKAQHFSRLHMTSVLPSAFYLPKMNMPLRNTKATLAKARLVENTSVKVLNSMDVVTTNPVYKVPQHLIAGLEGGEFFEPTYEDEGDMRGDGDWGEGDRAEVVGEACKDLLRRSSGVGFPILGGCYLDGYTLKGVRRAGLTALIYHKRSKECCSEAEVQEWLKRRKSGEEKRVLICDDDVIRGLETSHVLVVALGDKRGSENHVMRTVGFCATVTSKTY